MLSEWGIEIYLRKARYSVEVSVILVGIKQGKLSKWEIFSYSSTDYLCFDYYVYICNMNILILYCCSTGTIKRKSNKCLQPLNNIYPNALLTNLHIYVHNTCTCITKHACSFLINLFYWWIFISVEYSLMCKKCNV